ncbi:uncharacterized protein LOC112567783 [Pomacea canaliculata]|uniref:uncharacterized protein LOC112567783 n=1 Tax=Pomacea canaliculata TaxID=400727 RepID=UPI000D7263B1|nr:uncharacterized protein LOC112567783 [Pomacea canaliculata]
MHLTPDCTIITLAPNENGFTCANPGKDPLDIYFHPKNGSQRKVATCNSPGFDIYNDHGFSCKNGDSSSTQITVPTNFTEPGEFFCQVSGIGMYSKNSMSCMWPPNGNNSLFSPDAAIRYNNTMNLPLPVGIGLALLLLALMHIPLSRIGKKNKTCKMWTLYNKMFRKMTEKTQADKDFTNDRPGERTELLKTESEKIPDEKERTGYYSDTDVVPPCDTIVFRDKITTSERMRKLNENTVVEEEAEDPVCSSDIDMPIKTPVQIVSTDCGEEKKDTSTITCDTTDVDIHSGGIETTSANGANSDMRIQMESDHTEFPGEMEEDVFSFSGTDIDTQGEQECNFIPRQKVTVVKQATQNSK